MILIILLRTSPTINRIRNRFLKKLFSFKDLTNEFDEERKLTIHCLNHYLCSLRIDVSYDRIDTLYNTYEIESGSHVDICLKNLCQFLRDIFQDTQILLSTRSSQDENQQYLVSVNRIKSKSLNQYSLEHDLDLNTCCVLLNIFRDQLPSSYQILWCSTATDEDISLFFSRIRAFSSLTFVLMDIDKMHHRLRELLLNEQDLLTRQSNVHGSVYYFSNELTTGRKGLRIFEIPDEYKNVNMTYQHMLNLFQQNNLSLPNIDIIYGQAGIGKSCFSMSITLINSFFR